MTQYYDKDNDAIRNLKEFTLFWWQSIQYVVGFFFFLRTPGLETNISLPYFLSPGPKYILSIEDSSSFDKQTVSPGRRISFTCVDLSAIFQKLTSTGQYMK